MAEHKLYIQQYGSTVAKDTLASFGVVCQEFPFKVLPESKDLPKRDWYDQHGEDVYFPTDGLRFKAYDLEVKFLYKGTGHSTELPNESKESEMRRRLKAFIDFIYGRNTGGNPELMIYDEYTQTGRRGVYVTDVSNDLYFFNNVSMEAIAQFKVKFRVTDPVYEVSKSVNEQQQVVLS